MTYEEVDYPLLEEQWERDVMPANIDDVILDISMSMLDSRVPQEMVIPASRVLRPFLFGEWASNRLDPLRLGAELGCWPTFEQWMNERELDTAAQERAQEFAEDARGGRRRI